MASAFPEITERLAQLQGALDRARTAADLDDVRREIVSLLRALDDTQAQVTESRGTLKALAERYRGLAGAGLERAAGLEPADAPKVDTLGASTYVEKGWNYIAVGDYDQALQSLRRALELAPNDPKALVLIGWAQMRKGEYDGALLTFQQVLVREPQNALARINLGYVCLKKGIYGEAIEHLSRVLHESDDRKALLYAQYYLGLVYLERAMYRDAEAFFQRALELGPGLGEAHFDLGRARFLAGDRAGAVEAWRRGAEVNEYNDWGRRCQEAAARAEVGHARPYEL